MQQLKDTRQQDKAQIHQVQLVVAGENLPKPLQPPEQPLHPIALPIQLFILIPLNLAMPPRRHHWPVTQIGSQLPGNIPLISPIH